jgi:hypothetical protein
MRLNFRKNAKGKDNSSTAKSTIMTKSKISRLTKNTNAGESMMVATHLNGSTMSRKYNILDRSTSSRRLMTSNYIPLTDSRAHSRE